MPPLVGIASGKPEVIEPAEILSRSSGCSPPAPKCQGPVTASVGASTAVRRVRHVSVAPKRLAAMSRPMGLFYVLPKLVASQSRRPPTCVLRLPEGWRIPFCQGDLLVRVPKHLGGKVTKTEPYWVVTSKTVSEE
jgi:hypothetical protein